ncbi:hypothetical protein [Pseudoalteromonas umbrosa]|uniref:hypothetical protein n=1 Tax=Pseudoalteromonas umbrosa TaxID=3048489 RepID=UPI0024C36AE3|nr:hypothetical protein [Pseudoalteromonas sp. B95]MDK1289017.1 hypothetical protein [Pseudoalteromonas sp. B95]
MKTLPKLVLEYVVAGFGVSKGGGPKNNCVIGQEAARKIQGGSGADKVKDPKLEGKD